jgi:hypothetical protein
MQCASSFWSLSPRAESDDLNDRLAARIALQARAIPADCFRGQTGLILAGQSLELMADPGYTVRC